MVRSGRGGNASIEHLLDIFSTIQNPIAPGWNSDLASFVIVIACANFELVGRRELELCLLKLRENIPSLLFLKQLINFSELSKLIVFDFLDNIFIAVTIDPIVEVSAPQENVVLK